MRVLELFSGTKSVGKVCQEMGFEVLSVDIDPRHNPDLLLDIRDFDEFRYPKDHFQFIWASPPCESYSQARSNVKGDREEAMRSADDLVRKTLDIIQHFNQASWCIENPATSRLWMREVARGLAAQSTITSYCSFGTGYRKDTRISNSLGLVLPRCPGAGLCPAMVGSRHMSHAQKGGGGVTDKYHTLDELHSIPRGLVEDILRQVKHLESPHLNLSPPPRNPHETRERAAARRII